MFGFSDRFKKKSVLPGENEVLPGRKTPIEVQSQHYVLGVDITGSYPSETEKIVFAMGCFWGAERLFWQQRGIYATAAGYIGGKTPNPTYEEVCSGLTGHTEGVLVVFDPLTIDFWRLLKLFWEQHDPTQGMRQGNDVGTQYRSAVYCYTNEQRRLAELSKEKYQQQLTAKGLGQITTEIGMASDFFFAETWHQQYLAKNPGGYCGLSGVGACFDMDACFEMEK
jgi:peptide-methionine (S)-S-oxide reductase